MATSLGRVIDLHAHPLPGLDDGPAGLEEALTMARAAADAGTRVMAATPHIDYRWRVVPQEIPAAVDAFNAQLAEAEIGLSVVQGGELAVSRLGELGPADLAAVRLGGGPYLLVECPHAVVGSAFGMMVFDLLAQGEHVLLAHPERSPIFLDDLETLDRLVRGGVLCSITAGSLVGSFGEPVRRFAVRLVAEGLVHDIASDAHDDVRRPPGLLAALEEADRDLPGLADQAEWYLEAAPEAILAGDPLPPQPSPPTPRRRRRWLPTGRH